MKNKKLKQKKKGYAALMGVLILGLVIALLVPALLINSTDNFKISESITNSNQALVQTESCAEIALEKLRQNNSYSGNETISLSTGTCTIRPISGSGQTKTIELSSNVNSYTRKVRIITSQLTPLILVSSWQDISDF